MQCCEISLLVCAWCNGWCKYSDPPPLQVMIVLLLRAAQCLLSPYFLKVEKKSKFEVWGAVSGRSVVQEVKVPFILPQTRLMRLETECHSWSISSACISWQSREVSYKPAVYIQISVGMRTRPAKVHFCKKHPITCFYLFLVRVRTLWGSALKVLKCSFKGALCSSEPRILIFTISVKSQ